MENFEYTLTLLKDIRDDEFESLIEQEKLVLDGYKMHFIIDQDLIGNYCYPLGIIEEETGLERKSKLNVDYLSDEQVTLHSIFYLNQESDRVLFLNQYSLEFENMITKAAKYEIDYKINFGLYEKKFSEISDEFRAMLYESFSRMYAKALMQINGLRKVDNILRDKAIMFDSIELDNEFLRIAVDINVGTIERTEIISSTLKSILQSRDTESDSNKIRPSKKRDALVIDRVLAFNSYIQEKGEGEDKKHIFILLTDSSQTKQILYRLKNGGTGLDYPEINNRKILFIRNVRQVFVHLICLSYDAFGKLDMNKTIKNIEELRKVNQEVSDQFKKARIILRIKEGELLSQTIFSNYLKIRNAFENTGILKSFDQLYKTVKNEMNGRAIQDVAGMFKMIIEDQKFLQKELSKKHVGYLQSLRKEVEFNLVFINGMEKIRKSNASLVIIKGEDYIEGRYQHLPFFLTFPQESPELTIHMKRLIKFVLERQTDYSKEICVELESILDLMKSTRVDDEKMGGVNLLKTFFFMILPNFDYDDRKDNNDTENNNDQIAYKWLKKMPEHGLSNDHFEKNRLYLLVWACRRTKKYQDALDYAETGIKKYPTDPRFYHGKFLAQFCIFKETRDTKHTKPLSAINEILETLERTYNLYNGFLEDNFNDDYKFYNTIISKFGDNYYNSKCDCLSYKIGILHDQNESPEKILTLLVEARAELDKLKVGLKFREELPEYYDTEAYLEYFESFYYSNRLEKINFSKMAIEKAITLSDHESTKIKYTKTLKMIEERISVLSQ